MQRGSQLWLVSAGQRCCRRPGWGRGDVVHRATAGNLVRRGQAGARPVLRCRRPPLVTISSSCCAGRSGSLPGKPLTGGTGAATEATAAGPHTGAGATGTSPLSEGHSTQDKSRCQALLQAPSDTSPAAAAHEVTDRQARGLAEDPKASSTQHGQPSWPLCWAPPVCQAWPGPWRIGDREAGRAPAQGHGRPRGHATIPAQSCSSVSRGAAWPPAS